MRSAFESVGGSAKGLELSPTSSIHVLVVDDDRSLRDACTSYLNAEGYAVAATGSGFEALEMLARRHFDFILVDLYMSQVSGMDIMAAALQANKDVLVALMTGNPSVESSVRALRAGAWEYVVKPFSPAHMEVLLGRAAHVISTMRARRDTAAQVTRETSNSDLVTCIGISPSFRRAVELARRVAPTDASIMLTGESGSGKEVLAQLIHRHSARGGKRLVPINCAALPENLLESEMFGHRKGAFTGADRDKPGLLEMAHGGTLFLDELTEMSPRLQAKLLRVIQDGVVRRVGSEHQDSVVDVRFISATNIDPHDAIRRGLLRKDLFYRLRVVSLNLPPLRQRVEDIPVLAVHFLAQYWTRYRRSRDEIPRFSASTLNVLSSRLWHGNVRELQNVIEHLAVMAEPGQHIQPDDLPFHDEGADLAGETAIPLSLLDEGYYTARDRLVSDFERAYLLRLVGRAGGNMSKAARIASIDRTTLYRLIDRHQVNTRIADHASRGD
jgi:DNA-binding NtrC family response regulator